MKGVLTTKLESKNRTGAKPFVLNYIIYPIRAGIFGFTAFFIVLILAKYFGYLLGSINTFEIDFGDAGLSLMGFVLVFLIRLLENFNEKTSS